MIAYKDFLGNRTVVLGQVVNSPGARKTTIASAVQEANAWLEEAGKAVTVVSVETVPDGRGTSCIRVWYTTGVSAQTI